VKTCFLSTICFGTHEVETKNFYPFVMKRKGGDLIQAEPKTERMPGGNLLTENTEAKQLETDSCRSFRG
jgi:hypothetical protein